MKKLLPIFVTLLTLFAPSEAWADESGLFDVNRFSWEYVTSTHTLTIQHVSGSSDMTDFESNGIRKWESYKNNIQHLVIGSGITYIGKYAFKNLPALQDVTFEAGSALESIGQYAFYNCTNLTSITLPEGLTTIGDWTFYNCTSLTSITLPESLTTIKQKAFNKTGLTSVTIPANVTNIGYNAFTDCSSLTSVTMNIIDPTTLSLQESVFRSGMTIYVSDVDAWKARFPYDPIDFPNYNYNYTEMSSSSWTSGDTDVKLYTNGEMFISKKAGDGNGAMADYESESDRPWDAQRNNIKKVVIQSGVTTIGKYAFYDCTSLSSVVIPASMTNIKYKAFTDCNSLISVTMNVIDPATLSLDIDAFQSGVTVYVSDIDAWNARFPYATYQCIFTEMSSTSWTSGDTDVKLYTNGEMFISKKAGDGNGAMADYESESDRPWDAQRNNIKKVVFKSCVTTIGKYAFYNCTSLSLLTLTEGLTTIGNNAFNKTGLTSVTIPSSVTTFGEYAFSECTSLSSLTLTEGLTTIGNYAFEKTGLTLVTIPSSVTNFGEDAFSACSSLSSLTLTEGLTTIGNDAFYNTGLTSVTIPSSVKTIDKGTFSSCPSLSSLTLTEGLTTIGNYAFFNSGLTSVTIPSSVKTIGEGAFFYCTNLSSVTIYAPSLTTYGEDAFYNNASERKIYVFSDCVDTYKAGWSSYVNEIKPIPDLTANDAGGELGRWCTYYNGLADVTVNEKTTVYTAAVNGSDQVALTPTGSRIVKRGEAVLLNSTVGNITLSSAASSGDGDYTGNELKGVDYETAQAEGTTYYVLSKKEDIFGFYKLAEGVKLGANKAYLAESSSSRDFFGLEEETTSLTPVPSPIGEGSDRWYTLQGHKIANSQKPKAKGIYIHNGRKEVLK